MLFSKSLSLKIIEISLGAIIGGFITLFVFGTANLEYLESYNNQYFKLPEKAPDELNIQYKGKEIENISFYDFNIYNRSFKDLEDVTIYFEVTKKDDKPIPLLINRGVYPPSHLPDEIGITEIKQTQGNLYAFHLDVVKETGSNSFYSARFIFKGNETPNIKISAPNKAGVKFTEYSHWREYVIITVSFLSFIMVAIIITSIAEGWQSNKIWYKRKKRLFSVLDSLHSMVLPEETIGEISDKYDSEFKTKPPYFYKAVTSIIKKKSNN